MKENNSAEGTVILHYVQLQDACQCGCQCKRARARGTHAWCNCAVMYRICNSNAQHGYASAALESRRYHKPQLIIYIDVISLQGQSLSGECRPAAFAGRRHFTDIRHVSLDARSRETLHPARSALETCSDPSPAAEPATLRPGMPPQKAPFQLQCARKPREKAVISPDAHAGCKRQQGWL